MPESLFVPKRLGLPVEDTWLIYAGVQAKSTATPKPFIEQGNGEAALKVCLSVPSLLHLLSPQVCFCLKSPSVTEVQAGPIKTANSYDSTEG